VPLGRPLLLLPVLIAVEFFLALGLTLIAAAINIHFRDLQHLILHLLTVLQFLTPIFYPLSIVPDAFRPWAFLNPLTVLMDAFHDVLYRNQLPHAPALIALFALAWVVLSFATALFNRYKQTFAEAL
jgi:ABC-type polysaccharide/polyol phosphate export permease